MPFLNTCAQGWQFVGMPQTSTGVPIRVIERGTAQRFNAEFARVAPYTDIWGTSLLRLRL